ncbi:MAG: hypothetical protein CMD32_07695 [Flavobacteriales bacterium]|jgi:hypothetical protein|nr:hypothetical protein [Flavobacteriales bacterium]|tara:strand:- start:423 stop:674 length:252 start_codon:yes stop_codon:yes gene_type:complete
MGKLIFRYTDELVNEIREAKEIELTVPDDMDINEFKVMCVRMASAMGYQEKSIQKGFGDLVYGEEDVNTLKELLNELNIKRID